MIFKRDVMADCIVCGGFIASNRMPSMRYRISERLLFGLDVNVARAALEGVGDQVVHETDDGRLVAGFFEVVVAFLGLGDDLHIVVGHVLDDLVDLHVAVAGVHLLDDASDVGRRTCDDLDVLAHAATHFVEQEDVRRIGQADDDATGLVEAQRDRAVAAGEVGAKQFERAIVDRAAFRRLERNAHRLSQCRKHLCLGRGAHRDEDLRQRFAGRLRLHRAGLRELFVGDDAAFEQQLLDGPAHSRSDGRLPERGRAGGIGVDVRRLERGDGGGVGRLLAEHEEISPWLAAHAEAERVLAAADRDFIPCDLVDDKAFAGVAAFEAEFVVDHAGASGRAVQDRLEPQLAGGLERGLAFDFLLLARRIGGFRVLRDRLRRGRAVRERVGAGDSLRCQPRRRLYSEGFQQLVCLAQRVVDLRELLLAAGHEGVDGLLGRTDRRDFVGTGRPGALVHEVQAAAGDGGHHQQQGHRLIDGLLTRCRRGRLGLRRRVARVERLIQTHEGSSPALIDLRMRQLRAHRRC
ncbi:MAG: hypothetical protein QM770_22155 [Tepidisphaeraceae bacterium]